MTYFFRDLQDFHTPAPPQILQIFVTCYLIFFFGRRRLKKRSEKTRIARSKRKHRKGKGRGQAAKKIRSPLHLAWKRVLVRGAKVHACGAQIKQEFQEISGKVERVRGNS